MTDLTSMTFGLLTVLRFKRIRTFSDGSKRPVWECRCKCSNITEVIHNNLIRGGTKSCGCLKDNRSKITHGHSIGKMSRTYAAWSAMKYRCLARSCNAFPNYGGRGIKICDRWMRFENFLKDMGECPPHLTLERIDNDDNYRPGNCEWREMAEQNRNRRDSVKLTVGGNTLNASVWCRTLGMAKSTLHNRLRRGWTSEKALTTPVIKSRGKQ